MATEPVSGAVALFGGVINNTSQYNDTWEWRCDHWFLAATPTSPTPRESHWMAADGQGGVILFGGESFLFGGTLNDTWRYELGRWTPLNPPQSPPARRYHRMVATNSGVLLFGGYSGSPSSGNMADTWEWNGSTWTQHFPANSPAARSSHGMAYDALRDRVVVFGGQLNQNQVASDTWEWDGANWQRRFPASSPTSAAFLAFDPSRGLVTSYGGSVQTGLTAESWTWDGTNWSQVAVSLPNPGQRASPVAWSPLSGGLLVYGGHAPTNDTWLTDPVQVGSFASFGAGCSGPTGATPSLSGVAGAEPHLGRDAMLEVQALPTSITVPVFVYGLSNTVDPGPPGYTLPVDLGPLGWPGCQQLVSDDIYFLTITNTGSSNHSLSIPMDLGLLGFEYHAQAFVLYSPSGVAVTNGVTATVGL